MMKRNLLINGILIFASAILYSGVTIAQVSDYPSKTVSLVVPFPPGGAVDQAGRSVAQALYDVWKQPVVILNKGGAGGAIGMAAVANAPPDGYTLLATHSAIISIPASEKLFGRATSFDRSNFTPLALIVADPVVLIVPADSPWKTAQDFVADAKKRPDAITYSSSGAYSALHLPMEMFANSAGIKLRHVPFSGGGPALTAVLGGVVDVSTGVPAVVAPHIKSGKFRALLVTGYKRHPLLPDVPTAMELGYKDVEFYLWVGLFGPAKMDDDLVKKIRQGIAKAVVEPKFVEHMNQAGAPIDYRDAPAFNTFLNKDSDRINSAIKNIGKVD
jgi:tripartite-type tricarboxylate transporter receptor subunit TctC